MRARIVRGAAARQKSGGKNLAAKIRQNLVGSTSPQAAPSPKPQEVSPTGQQAAPSLKPQEVSPTGQQAAPSPKPQETSPTGQETHTHAPTALHYVK